jgi:GAF domain-containing protein
VSEFFPGDSEMAARMRSFDWSTSALGAPETWPVDLCAAARICLTSKFPMIVRWGTELRFFYNDAYVPLLGSKPPALGRSRPEVWPEIWHIVGPMLDGVLATGDTTWSYDLLLRWTAMGTGRRRTGRAPTARCTTTPARWAACSPPSRTPRRGWLGPGDWRLGDAWRETLQPDDRESYLAAYEQATRAGEPFDIEYRLRRAGGAYHWVLEHVVPIAKFGGHVASCVDVNERYREGERQRLLAQVSVALDTATGVRQRLDRLIGVLIEGRLADGCTITRITEAGHPIVMASVGATTAVTPTEEPTLISATELAVPLGARGEMLAVLTMHRSAYGSAYCEKDLALAEQIADRAGIALDNALLLADVTVWAANIGLPRAQAEDLLLVIGEATANAVEHAYRDLPAGELSYELRCTPEGGVVGTVVDHGNWRPVPVDNGTRGRGLSMIRAASVRSDVRGSDTGTRVEFELPAAVAAPGGRGYGRVHGQ